MQRVVQSAVVVCGVLLIFSGIAAAEGGLPLDAAEVTFLESLLDAFVEFFNDLRSLIGSDA